MIPPYQQAIHQITTTSLCWPKAKNGQLSACSNCTRMLGHEKRRFIMTPDQFEACAEVAKDFIYESPPCPRGRRKIIGIFGGDPILSPYFPEYVEILCQKVPDVIHRGLWVSLDWQTYVHPKYGPAEPHVIKLLGKRYNHHIGVNRHRGGGYINWNRHTEDQSCEHQPTLVSISDVVNDEKHKWELISECWVNRDWSAAYALDANGEPKFYFCEIASSFDRVFNLGTGLAVEPYVWRGELDFQSDENGILRPVGPYAQQILQTCGRCGASLPLPGRQDLQLIDDVSQSNLVALQQIGSPMVARGDVKVFDDSQIAQYNESRIREEHQWSPQEYIKRGSRTFKG